MWQGSKKRKPSFPLGVSGRRTLKQKTRLTNKSKLRQGRVKKRLYLSIAVLVLLVLSISGLSYLSFSKPLLVKEVQVSGGQIVHPVALEARSQQYSASAVAGLFSRQNILLYPSKDLERLLSFEFPRIETIDVKLHLIKRDVNIDISERVPYALWCKEVKKVEGEEKAVVSEECFLADKDGFLFAQASGTETMIKLYGGVKHPDGSMLRKSITPEYFQDVVTLFTGLQELDLHITQVTFTDDEAEVLVSPGWKLLITLSKDVSTVPINLATVLDENELGDQLDALEYVDLRFDDRAYYKLLE